jgi:hypothetical protein
VLNFAIEMVNFAMQVRTFRRQPSATRWQYSHRIESFLDFFAHSAYAALRALPLLFTNSEEFLEIGNCRLQAEDKYGTRELAGYVQPLKELQ